MLPNKSEQNSTEMEIRWMRIHPKTEWHDVKQPPGLLAVGRLAGQAELVLTDEGGRAYASDGTSLHRRPELDVLSNHPNVARVPLCIVEPQPSWDHLAERHPEALDACYEANDLFVVADLDGYFFDLDPESNVLRRRRDLDVLGRLPFDHLVLRPWGTT